METFNVNVKYNISESIENVFDAIMNPEKITKYFVSKVSGKLEQSKKIEWNFEDVGVKCEVDVLKVVENKQIDFTWNVIGFPSSEVNILLKSENDKQTSIDITERSFKFTKQGIQKALGQTQGWTDFICSLKAYLYAGINLRKGMK